jgi:transcriptional antiterminator RfaH
MGYWCAARLQPRHEAYALHCLTAAGYETYFPRLRDRRIRHGRKVELRPALFPGYAFVLIQLQWHAARWAPGTLGLIMNGAGPAHVPDGVIAEIRQREVDGLIELARPPALRRGARIRILHGPFSGHLAIFADMRPRERVEVLLQLLGTARRVELAKADIEAVQS